MIVENLVHKKRSGFTLVELIVVIAILAILAAILMPLIGGYMSQATDSVCRANRRIVMHTYYRYSVKEAQAWLDINSNVYTLIKKSVEETLSTVTVSQSNSFETRLQGACPTGGGEIIIAAKNGDISLKCSVHSGALEYTVTDQLHKDFDRYIYNWKAGDYGIPAHLRSNDRFRKAFYEENGNKWPELKVGNDLYYIQPYWDATSNEITMFAIKQDATNTVNNWYIDKIYDRDTQQWYSGKSFSIADQSWDANKGLMETNKWTALAEDSYQESNG